MRIVHLTAGTGHFYCGSCLRDHALCKALEEAGHAVDLVPLYLPLVLEEAVPAVDAPVLLGGVSMFLQQKAPALGLLPRRLQALWNAPPLLRRLSRHGRMTTSSALGALTVSTLRGERGRQRHEFDWLCRALEHRPRPDVAVVSNALLLGVARPLKRRLGVPVVCTLQGEAPFLDALPEPWRERAWDELGDCARGVDAFVAVSRYTAQLMRERLGLEHVHVVHNGIALEGLDGPRVEPPEPAVGFLARLCEQKGLATLVEAFLLLQEDPRWSTLRLIAAGALLREDRPLLERLRRRAKQRGVADRVEFHPDVSRSRKLELLHRVSVLSVPALYGESFGLYLLEAMAAGIPVVQPRHAGFVEVVEETGGGVLYEPFDAATLARHLARLLEDPPRLRGLGEQGRAAVRSRFTAAHMARGYLEVLAQTVGAARAG